MRRQLSICPGVFAVAACLAAVAPVGPAAAEHDPAHYQKACDAYNRGDFHTAFKDLMPYAVRGDAQSQFAFAEMMWSGSGTERNRKEALIDAMRLTRRYRSRRRPRRSD